VPWGIGIAIVLVGLIARVAQKRSLSGAGNKILMITFQKFPNYSYRYSKSGGGKISNVGGATLKRFVTDHASVVRSFTVVALVKYGRFFIQC
jgi:hypothetical protein